MCYFRAQALRTARDTLPLALLVSLFFIQPASAYVDPSTGSYILQLAMGFLFSALFTIKGFLKRLTKKRDEGRD